MTHGSSQLNKTDKKLTNFLYYTIQSEYMSLYRIVLLIKS